MKLTAAETAVLASVKADVHAQFGPRLRELALFGSRARGEGHEHSDLDVLIVVDDLTWREGRDFAEACGRYLTEYDVLASPFIVSAAYMTQLRSRERLIAEEIARDGIPL